MLKTPDHRIFLETFSPVYKQAYDFVIAIAEPETRPELIHIYRLTPYSLYAAAAIGLKTESIVDHLNKFSKTNVPENVAETIRTYTQRMGKVSACVGVLNSCAHKHKTSARARRHKHTNTQTHHTHHTGEAGPQGRTLLCGKQGSGGTAQAAERPSDTGRKPGPGYTHHYTRNTRKRH